MLLGWIFLVLAAVVEIVWFSTLKYTEGLTKLIPSIASLLLGLLDFYLLNKALNIVPTALAYSVWTAVASVGVFLIAVMYGGESLNAIQGIAFTVILLGCIVLRFAS